MNESEFRAEKAKEWFAKGDNDLRTTEILLTDPDPPTDTLCFHCQQAVEKYFKGVLTLNNIDFIKSHDLEYLLKLAAGHLKGIGNFEEGILSLNKYSVEPRYPADLPIYYSIGEAKQAFEKAKTIVKFIKDSLK